jgi:hypothetical protein
VQGQKRSEYGLCDAPRGCDEGTVIHKRSVRVLHYLRKAIQDDANLCPYCGRRVVHPAPSQKPEKYAAHDDGCLDGCIGLVRACSTYWQHRLCVTLVWRQ